MRLSLGCRWLGPARRSQRRRQERMRQLWEASDFVRKLRVQMRFGKLSRDPLKLLRFELRVDVAECGGRAGPADPWDTHLAPGVGKRNASSQALEDSLG